MKLAIVDLGYGNVGSIGIAFERFGLAPEVTADPERIAAADKIVLPGVGAAGHAMAQVGARGLGEILCALKQPLLGICLGMQLLFEGSDEDDAACLGLIPGRVRALDPGEGRPVPHMGWSRLTVRDDGLGLRDGDYVYFAHGFACDPGPETLASVDYGREIPAAVRSGSRFGAQFHPERSGEPGARFLKAFLDR